MHRFITTLIFLIPLSCLVKLGETDPWYSQYFFASFFIFLTLAVNLLKFSKPVGLFAACAVCSSYFTAQHSAISLMTLVQFMGFAYLSYHISSLKSLQRKTIFKALIGVFVLASVMMTLQILNIDPIFSSIADPTKDVIIGLSGSPNQFGLFMADMGVLSFIISPYLFLPALVGLVCSKTSFTLVGFIIGAVFFLKVIQYNILKYFLAVIAAMSLLFFIVVDQPSKYVFKERISVWKNSLQEVEKGVIQLTFRTNENTTITKYHEGNHWFGFGLGSFMKLSPYSQKRYLDDIQEIKHFKEGPKDRMISRGAHVYEHAHNDYVETYFDMGRVGFTLLTILLINVIRLYLTTPNKTTELHGYFSALMTHGISALGIYTVHTAVSGLLLAAIFGLFMGEIRDGRTPKLG